MPKIGDTAKTEQDVMAAMMRGLTDKYGVRYERRGNKIKKVTNGNVLDRDKSKRGNTNWSKQETIAVAKTDRFSHMRGDVSQRGVTQPKPKNAKKRK